MKTAIIGWGSLLWDDRPQFDQHHGQWYFDGPLLRLEFSRISVRRDRALTLVLERAIGAECQVAYTISRREAPQHAIEDLRIREGATSEQVGVYRKKSDRSDKGGSVPDVIRNWADSTDFDVVIWTALPNNFQELSSTSEPFSIPAAIAHLQSLPSHAQICAAQYVFEAPSFIRTPLRTHLEQIDWFAETWHRSGLQRSQ